MKNLFSSPGRIAIVLAVTAIAGAGIGVGLDRVVDSDSGGPKPSPCASWRQGAARAANARAIELVTRGLDVAIFLDLDISDRARDHIRRTLPSLPDVARFEFETKDEAFQRFSEAFADKAEIIRNTTAATLPESFHVKLTGDSFESLRTKVEALPGVSQVRDDRKILNGTRPALTNNNGPLFVINQRGYYLDAKGNRITRPAGCTE
jgi:FtsX-like permease family protein